MALRRDIVRRSLRVALVVGLILAVINHGDRVLAGTVDAGVMLKIVLTFIVPYSVATWSAVQTARAQSAGG